MHRNSLHIQVGPNVGIRVLAAGNLIIGNRVGGVASGVIGFDVLPGNTMGPIVNIGNIATSDNPHANYEY